MREDLWTQAEIAQLRRMFADGNSPSAIASTMGRTRNAVIGRLNRMGLRCKPEVTKRSRQHGQIVRRKAVSREWTSQEVAELADLVTRGFSATQIGKLMNRPRNSVMTRAWRDGLRLGGSKNNNPPGWRGIVKPAPAPRQPKPMLFQDGNRHAPGLPPTLPSVASKSIDTLAPRQCRYIGERPALMTLETLIYCGQPTDGGSWCPEHRARCVVPLRR